MAKNLKYTIYEYPEGCGYNIKNEHDNDKNEHFEYWVTRDTMNLAQVGVFLRNQGDFLKNSTIIFQLCYTPICKVIVEIFGEHMECGIINNNVLHVGTWNGKLNI